MPRFTVNPTRFDPYKAFKFRVLWDGRVVAGISRVSGLTRSTEVVQHREGRDPSATRRAPGLTTYAPITLERGITHDTDFESWANQVWSFRNMSGSEVSLARFRKDVRIELLNEAGQIVIAYDVFRCWVSDYTALPELDASGAIVAIESITLQNEGWERDHAVAEPAEPSFSGE